MEIDGRRRLLGISVVLGLLLASCASPDRQIDPGKIRVKAPVSGPITRLHVVRQPASSGNVMTPIAWESRLVGHWNGPEFDKRFGSRLVENLELNGIRTSYQGVTQAIPSDQVSRENTHVLVIRPTRVTIHSNATPIYKVSVGLSSPGADAPQIEYEDDIWDLNVWEHQRFLATDRFAFSLLNFLRDQQLVKWSGDFKVGNK